MRISCIFSNDHLMNGYSYHTIYTFKVIAHTEKVGKNLLLLACTISTFFWRIKFYTECKMIARLQRSEHEMKMNFIQK
jgi:hypothetical protein